MQVKIRSCSRISLRRLVPAFPMRITSYRGPHGMTRRGFYRTLREGQPVYIPAFEPFDLHVGGSPFASSTCHIELDGARADSSAEVTALMSATSRPYGQTLREAISATVFHQPQREWNAELVANALSTTTHCVRRTLFMQGAALTELCRTQRLMRALFESIKMDLSVYELRARIGWPRGDLEESFYEHFGVSLHTASRLRGGGL